MSDTYDKSSKLKIGAEDLEQANFKTTVSKKVARRVGNEAEEPLYVENEFLRTLVPILNEHYAKLNQLLEAVQLSKADNVELSNGLGNDVKAKINKFNALKVVNQFIPDTSDPTIAVPITGYFTDANGNRDARANASLAAPADFNILSDTKQDIFINSISFLISDQNAILSNWGNIGELTNGIQLVYFNNEVGEVVLADEITTNFKLIRLCTDTPPVSDNVSAFRSDNISGNSEGYICILKFDTFGLPYGLRLRGGLRDRLTVRIRDNISNIDAFDVFYYGSKIIQ